MSQHPEKTVAATTQADVAAIIEDSFRRDLPLYAVGGGTSLDYGLPIKAAGKSLSLAKLDQIVDYPARDMTVTVEAGVTMKSLADLLAKEQQRLPIDVPRAAEATIGGVVATNWNGPRRYAEGTVRDFVIGIHAVDGRGLPFKGGGRVVKNVAGYDFCKLLTGSLGTLGVITQVTLRLKPIPEQSVLMACAPVDLPAAEKLLAGLVTSRTTPVAIELLAGPEWAAEPSLRGLARNSASLFLVVGLEGTGPEVEYMTRQLADEWHASGIEEPLVVGEGTTLWQKLIEFPVLGQSPLVLQASVAPSGTTAMIEAARQLDPECSIQAHAGNGSLIIKFSTFPAQGLSRALVGNLQPVAATHGGHVTVVSNPSGAEMTHQSAWGAINAPLDVMSEVKRRFDPKDILNRGRFIYS